MNGKLQSSDVKNETPYNIPLLINENVISSVSGSSEPY